MFEPIFESIVSILFILTIAQPRALQLSKNEEDAIIKQKESETEKTILWY